MAPRIVLGQAARRKKEEEMHRLQQALDPLLTRINELSAGEHGTLRSLQAAYLATRASTENSLPLGTVVRTIGALLLSTITLLLSAFAQRWIGDAMTPMNR